MRLCALAIVVTFATVCSGLPVIPPRIFNPEQGQIKVLLTRSPAHSLPKASASYWTPSAENTVVHLPGRSGPTYDKESNIITMQYGDDKLHGQIGHVQRNQKEFPENARPMDTMPPKDGSNRAQALAGINIVGAQHPVAGFRLVRDEKLANMLMNPNHAASTTVEYLDDHESGKCLPFCVCSLVCVDMGFLALEGQYMGQTRKKLIEHPGAKIQLRANPG